MKLTSGLIVASGAATLAAAQSDIQCQDGVHIIVARASEEKPGFGVLGAVKDQVLSQIPSSNAVAVPYPAVIQAPNLTYPQSVQEGYGNMTQLVTDYGDACPNGKMVLMGYSQGAQVVGDTLIGEDYEKFPVFGNKSGLDEKYIKNVVAVVMMGDPSHVPGVSIDFGNSTRDGFFPRSNSDDWESTGLANRTISYCDAEDFYCDSGKAPNSHQIHAGYVAEYGTQAVNFVVKAYRAATGSSSTGGSGLVSASSSSQRGAPTPTTGGAAIPTSAGPRSTATGDATTDGGAATGGAETGGANPTATAASNTAAPPASGTGAAVAPINTGAASTLRAGSMAYLLSGLVGLGMYYGI